MPTPRATTSPKKRSWQDSFRQGHNQRSPSSSIMTTTDSSTPGIVIIPTAQTQQSHAPPDVQMNTSLDTLESHMHTIFEGFRSELDEHYDRRERIIKVSRDITALSKKIIFALQRIRKIPSPNLPPGIAKEVHPKFAQISTLFTSIVPDLSDQTTGPNPWRYQRQISPGIQEFVEALSFYHYVRTQRLITLPEVRASEYLPQPSQSQPRSNQGNGPPSQGGEKDPKCNDPDGGTHGSSSLVIITEEDYLMGVFDLSGEMMRLAVTLLSNAPPAPAPTIPGIQAKGQLQPEPGQSPLADIQAQETSGQGGQGGRVRALEPHQAAMVKDLRDLRAKCEALGVPRRHAPFMMRDLVKKLEVMQQSVEKVERAAYGILVRGTERPSGWMPDLGGGSGRGNIGSMEEVEI